VQDLLADYIQECLDRGILELRVIHGKGTRTLRRVVHAALTRHPDVAGYAPAGESAGGWGATLVTLKPRP
jgi:DNA-nicking Smr family endonuclease